MKIKNKKQKAYNFTAVQTLQLQIVTDKNREEAKKMAEIYLGMNDAVDSIFKHTDNLKMVSEYTIEDNEE